MASIIIDHLDEEELADLRAIIADAIELQNDHSTIVWLALSQVELFLQKLQQQHLYSCVWLTAARPTHFARLAICSLLRSRTTRHPKSSIRAFSRSAPTNRSGGSPIPMYGGAGEAWLVNFRRARRAAPRRKCTPV